MISKLYLLPNSPKQSPWGWGLTEKERVRPGSAETESKTPLKEGWPQPNSSSADKGVTEQVCPFPGASVSSPCPMRKQITQGPKAPAALLRQERAASVGFYYL